MQKADKRPNDAAEQPAAPDKAFTPAELEMLSNALIVAIQNNNDAARLTVSREAVEAIGRSSKALAALNSKICGMMEE